MRYLMLALIALSFPLFHALLSQHPERRPIAFAALAGMLFLGGDITIQAFIYGWPSWEGTIKGFSISFVDTLALALIFTRRPKITMLPFIGCFVIYGICIIISIIPAEIPVATLFAQWQYAKMILLFLVIGLEAGRADVRNSILTGLCIGLIVQTFFVVQQKLHGVVQAGGTMGHQNILGMVIEVAMLPLFAAMLAGDKRILIKVGVICGLTMVALGGSRATLGLVGGALVILMLLSFIRRATPTKAKVLGLAVVTMLAIAPFAYQTLNKRFGGATIVTEERERKALENVAGMMASDYVFGVGPNNFVLISNTKGYAERAGLGWFGGTRARPAHNAYLLARAETGWPGEIAFIVLILIPIYRGLRFSFANRSSASGELVLGCSIALSAVALHSNYEYALFTYHVFALFVVNLAIIAAQIASYDLAKKRDASQRAVKQRLVKAPQLA